jgi:predicted oxidoreductase
MSESLVDLEHQRNAILQQMLHLPDFRSGSITPTRGTCGKANCRCHQPNQPGHGPNYRLTRKVKGKTVTETFATSAELHKAQREVEVYHRFRRLAQELLEINEKICQIRPIEQELNPSKKKRRKSSSRKWLAK